jgi:hypothetical protein
MAKKIKDSEHNKFESKYSALNKDKLDDLYYTNLLRELWAIPHKFIVSYIKKYYPNPTAMELVEINDLLRIVKKAKKLKPLTEEDQKAIQYKHNRMYGKTRQVVEISGRDGGPIEYSDLSDDELKDVLHGKISQIKTALAKSKKD